VPACREPFSLLEGRTAQGRERKKTRVEGAHEVAAVIGQRDVIAASLITVEKPIITRSGGWVRPETWTIHGQRCDMACAVVRMDITVFCYTSPMPFLPSRGRIPRGVGYTTYVFFFCYYYYYHHHHHHHQQLRYAQYCL
jgi:hypothetical protein